MVENPDVLRALSNSDNQRPALVIGFAAETDDVVNNAVVKRTRKGCDWIVANDVSPSTGTFGGDENTIHLVTVDGVESWPALAKADVATQLTKRIVDHLSSLPEAAE